MLDTPITFSEISSLLGTIGFLVTVVIFLWSQRKKIDDIKTTVDTMQESSREFQTHVDTALTKYDIRFESNSKEHDSHTKSLTSLITSHNTTQMSIEFMQKMNDKMSQAMDGVTNSVSQLSIVIDNQSKATNELIIILKSTKFNN